MNRPCEFGKGTLLSTLDEQFQQGVEPYGGNYSYFKGLALEQLRQDDGSYLVLHLDFRELNQSCNTVVQFEQTSDDVSCLVLSS